MKRLTEISDTGDIYSQYRNTPISLLIEYHNLDRNHDKYSNAQILVGMCMDNRKHLNIPDNFAYIIRTGGANLRYSEFKVSYAVSVGGIRNIVLIGHNNCGMVNLHSRKEEFINGLVDAGWEKDMAEDHFSHFSPMFEIGNEIDFILTETNRLRLRYPKVTVAPLFYKIEDNRLYLINEK